MSDTYALDHFFDNGNWQSGDDGDWQYVGEIDPKRASSELTELYLDRGELTFRRRQFLEMDDQLAKLRVERDEMREALEMVSDHIDINYGAHPDIPAYAKAAAVLAKYPVTSPNGDYCVCEEFGISNYSIRCVNCGKPHAPRR